MVCPGVRQQREGKTNPKVDAQNAGFFSQAPQGRDELDDKISRLTKIPSRRQLRTLTRVEVSLENAGRFIMCRSMNISAKVEEFTAADAEAVLNGTAEENLVNISGND